MAEAYHGETDQEQRMTSQVTRNKPNQPSQVRDPERQRNLLGLRVEDWTMPELVEVLDRAVVQRTPMHVWGLNVPMFGQVRTYPQLVDFTNEFDIMVADGAGIPLVGRVVGQQVRAHVGLPYVSAAMIELAAQKGYRLLLFGATAEVNAEARRRIQAKYPAIQLCPGIDGYYPPEEEPQVAQRIRDLQPDILLVGITFPKKELFLLLWKDFMQVPVSVGCGGYFDVLAGKTSLAPKLIERAALSWVWRFLYFASYCGGPSSGTKPRPRYPPTVECQDIPG
jgi:N-acetylglucosaminyldiphosphoundecaprenol N-acetyl-beta-D-mannosaminyltransferase